MKTIIEMAREAGFTPSQDQKAYIEMLEHFAALVRAEAQAEEREACLGLAKDFAHNNADLHEAIRARGNT